MIDFKFTKEEFKDMIAVCDREHFDGGDWQTYSYFISNNKNFFSRLNIKKNFLIIHDILTYNVRLNIIQKSETKVVKAKYYKNFILKLHSDGFIRLWKK